MYPSTNHPRKQCNVCHERMSLKIRKGQEERGTGNGNGKREFGNEFTAVIRCEIPLYFDFALFTILSN